jgi:Flp pilus assembly protein TadG
MRLTLSLLRRFRPRRRHRSLGQSLVEFALVLPVMLLIVVVAVDFGRLFLGYVSLDNAARIGANYAALNPTADYTNANDVGRKRYARLISNELTESNCLVGSMSMPTFSPSNKLGGNATVSLTCQFRFITPGITAILGSQVPITASSVFPVRSGEYETTAMPSAAPSTAPPSTAPPSSPPVLCNAPQLVNHWVNEAATLWSGAGFTGTVKSLPANQDFNIATQSLVGGQDYPCDSDITVKK